MRRIEMYSSSRDLRRGLSRVLSLLAVDPDADERTPWWARLPDSLSDRARSGALCLEELCALLLAPEHFAAMDRVRERLGVAHLSQSELRGCCRRAVISGRAHADHMGRDIYGESNKALWDLVVAPLGCVVADRWGPGIADSPVVDARARTIPPSLRDLLGALVALKTGPRDTGHEPCAQWLAARLEGLGFEVDFHRRSGSPPVLEARREARGLGGHLVLYGHYDTVQAERARWSSDPDQLCERDGRLYARGIADNKGPLATRLWALAGLERSPAITWLIQGEEETGSAWSREVLGRLMPELQADLWLDETGYHDHADGTLRLLTRTIGDETDSSRPPDGVLDGILDGLRVLAAGAGLATRTEVRGLNKSVVAGGCPFNHTLPVGARYLALGVNDSRAGIHGGDESLPAWTFELHRDELALLFHAVGKLAEAQS